MHPFSLFCLLLVLTSLHWLVRDEKPERSRLGPLCEAELCARRLAVSAGVLRQAVHNEEVLVRLRDRPVSLAGLFQKRCLDTCADDLPRALQTAIGQLECRFVAAESLDDAAFAMGPAELFDFWAMIRSSETADKRAQQKEQGKPEYSAPEELVLYSGESLCRRLPLDLVLTALRKLGAFPATLTFRAGDASSCGSLELVSLLPGEASGFSGGSL